MAKAPVEQFGALARVRGITHAFTQRVPGLDVQTDRELALQRLDQYHAAARESLGLSGRKFVTATQVHGAEVTAVTAATSVPVPEADGLISNDADVCLGIYVADCCAVYLTDPQQRVIALLHSGKKGTEQGISGIAVRKMVEQYGSDPRDIVAQLSPCIWPPDYEIDFAAQIIADLRSAGVEQIHNSPASTSAHPERYYSYRMEKGKTGRMLALLALQG